MAFEHIYDGDEHRLISTSPQDFIGWEVLEVKHHKEGWATVEVHRDFHTATVYTRYEHFPKHWARPDVVRVIDDRFSTFVEHARPTADVCLGKTERIRCMDCGATMVIPMIVNQHDYERMQWMLGKLEEALRETAPRGPELAVYLQDLMERCLKKHKIYRNKNGGLLTDVSSTEGMKGDSR